jgi:hypothetical protein
MFEHLDDPEPTHPAHVDGVVARGRRLRVRRRLIAVAALAAVLVGTITTAAALQGASHNKVLITNEPTSTTVSDTTVPTTETTVDEVTTTTAPVRRIITATPTTSTTSTTQPAHDPHDLSMVSIEWPPGTWSAGLGCPGATPCKNAFGMDGNSSTQLSYTVINRGSWTVQLSECASNTVDIWTTPATSGFGQYSDGIWPEPYPARGAGAQPTACARVDTVLLPGATETRTETIVAGYKNAAGDLMPAAPGMTWFSPSFLPQCAQPCPSYRPGSISVTVFSPQSPESVFKIDVKTKNPRAVSGGSATVELTYTNALAFSVRMHLFGPCWSVKSGTATVDCSGRLPGVVVGPHQTVDLVGTIWARSGFTEAGAPLAPGNYALNLGDLRGSVYLAAPVPPSLTVTP